MNKRILFLTSAVLFFVVLFTQCTEDEEINQKAGTLVLKITDAASDDENIKGIYITVADLKVDGKPIRNFNPKTLILSELRNGQSEVLISKELAAKEYGQISLVLASDENGSDDAPGCYVLTKDNSKHNLITDNSSSAQLEIPASINFELMPGKETNLVIDFDLRKAVIRADSGKYSYSFVTQPELENAVRVIKEENSGWITGKVKSNFSVNTEIYVLVYKKGEFKPWVEGIGKGKSEILFANAISSAKVEPDGSYHLAFIEEGEYEVRLALYKRNSDNIFTFYGFPGTSNKRNGTFLNDVSVKAGSETTFNIEAFSLY